MNWARLHRFSQTALLGALIAFPGAALADETVTLTTFYPQQPAQMVALGAPDATAPAAFTAVGGVGGVRITTTGAARLLIVWSLQVTTSAAAGTRMVSSRVWAGGAQRGGTVTTSVPPNQTRTQTGFAVVTSAIAAGNVDLQWSVVGGATTAVAGNTTLGVIELR